MRLACVCLVLLVAMFPASVSAETQVNVRECLHLTADDGHPEGWPCKPFQHPAKVSVFVKRELVDNGFRPRMLWIKASPRQFQFRGVQDGVEIIGMVVKSGPREIAIGLSSVSPRWGRTYRYKLAFLA